MTYQEIVDYLFSNRDEKHAKFSGTLSNSEYITIGVKNPVLRQLAKDHYKDKDLLFEDFELSKYLEVDFVYFAVGLKRCKNIQEQLEFLDKNLKYAKSWAITDTINNSLKKCDFDLFWEFFLNHYNSEHLYTRRFAYIFGLTQYKNERIVYVFDHLREFDEYMVMMSEAWLLQTIAICYPNSVYETLSKLKDQKLKLKTISKICDSFRFSEAQKERFKSLRLK